MDVRFSNHALTTSLPRLQRLYGITLTREDIEDMIHNPQCSETRPQPDASEAEKLIRGFPMHVVYCDMDEFHLLVTVYVAREPKI